jgi:hypothetical protein
MTNLETVAAQRDELAAKLRTMGQQLEAANAEIARLKERAAHMTEPGHGEPIRTTYHADENTVVIRDQVAPGELVTVAPIPVKADLVTAQPANQDGTPFGGAVHRGYPGEVPATTPPKSKRPRIFGGKP